MVNVVRVNDRGLRNMLAVLGRNDGRSIKVGIFEESRAVRSSSNNAADQLSYRYAIHDEGRGNNPTRETLRPGLERALASDPVVRKFLALNLDKGQAAFEREVTKASLRLVARVKLAITRLKSPAKKQSTVRAAQRRYGGGARTNPLIQTGETRNAVDFRYV